MKDDPVEAALERLDEIPLHTAAGRTAFANALAAKSSLIVAKAARLIGHAQWTELNAEMAAAFDRTIAKGSAADKGCAATIAIARALVRLEDDAADLFLRGMRHVQMEGSYGPPVDAAVELRAVCAMGLANSSYPHKLREMVPLLVDKEWQVRAGAVRAIAVVGNEAASLLLRFKMLSGDRDPEVMSDCFLAILALEGGEGVGLVGPFAHSGRPEVREAAILALGASRRVDAVEWLIAEFGKTADPAGRKCLLLSLSTSRVEEAVAFLLELIRNGSPAASALAFDALSIHARDAQLSARAEAAMGARGSSGDIGD